MADESLDALIADAEMGEQAKKFLASELGEVLVGIARKQVEAAQIALADVDPTDPRAIMRLQNEIKFGTCFEQWLVELVHNGENAMSIYMSQKQENNQ